jgi:hypothetical protein
MIYRWKRVWDEELVAVFGGHGDDDDHHHVDNNDVIWGKLTKKSVSRMTITNIT